MMVKIEFCRCNSNYMIDNHNQYGAFTDLYHMFQLAKSFVSRDIHRFQGPNLCKLLCTSPRYAYIKKKDLDDIAEAHGSTTIEKIKMYSRQAKHIYIEGYKSFRKDIEAYLKLKKQEWAEQTLTHEQIVLKKRMRQELHRMKALVVIQILPMSGPLLIYYLYTYPTSIPTWFCIDSLHEDYQMECIRKQLQAIQHFQNHPLSVDKIQLTLMKLPELKKLSELLFGHFEDGIMGYNKMMKKDKSYLLHPSFSKLLLIRNIKNEFREDLIQHQELKEMSWEDRIAWKYKKVLNKESLLTFHKIQHQDSDLSIDVPHLETGKQQKPAKIQQKGATRSRKNHKRH